MPKKIPTTDSEYARACQLIVLFPGVFSDTAWKNFLRNGSIPSSRPEGTRSRLVRIADVRAFLDGTGGKGGAL